MASEIHAQVSGGQWFYRIWSTVVDDYTTESLTEGQLVAQYLLDELDKAVDRVIVMVDRARKRGTSSHLSTRDVDDSWDEPLQDEEDDDEAECAYHAVTGE